MQLFTFLFLLALLLTGCFEREIYTEVKNKTYISHPPKSLHILGTKGRLRSGFPEDPKAGIHLEIYTHSAHCTNAQSRSLGTDFDGYIRITIKEQNTTIARAQMDYKGEPDAQTIQVVYDHLIEELKWR